ncbi:MAG: hypothetical protein LBC61_00900 [Candidatus Peribacteria bacterium]|jgi:hypothetical protein|nr:hypothetical protein [Candidatus Peribacteria bacterium]
MKNFLKNYLSTIAFIAFAYFFYTHNNYYQGTLFFDLSFSITSSTSVDIFTFNTINAFNYLIIFYLIILVPFYIIESENSKARNVVEAVIKKTKDAKYRITEMEKTSILAWCVKLFFVPLMIAWCVQNGVNILNKIPSLWANKELFTENFRYFFDNYLFLTLY